MIKKRKGSEEPFWRSFFSSSRFDIDTADAGAAVAVVVRIAAGRGDRSGLSAVLNAAAMMVVVMAVRHGLLQCGECLLGAAEVSRTQRLLQRLQGIALLITAVLKIGLLAVLALHDGNEILLVGLKRRECLLGAGEIARIQRLTQCAEIAIALLDPALHADQKWIGCRRYAGY